MRAICCDKNIESPLSNECMKREYETQSICDYKDMEKIPEEFLCDMSSHLTKRLICQEAIKHPKIKEFITLNIKWVDKHRKPESFTSYFHKLEIALHNIQIANRDMNDCEMVDQESCIKFLSELKSNIDVIALLSEESVALSSLQAMSFECEGIIKGLIEYFQLFNDIKAKFNNNLHMSVFKIHSKLLAADLMLSYIKKRPIATSASTQKLMLYKIDDEIAQATQDIFEYRQKTLSMMNICKQIENSVESLKNYLSFCDVFILAPESVKEYARRLLCTEDDSLLEMYEPFFGILIEIIYGNLSNITACTQKTTESLEKLKSCEIACKYKIGYHFHSSDFKTSKFVKFYENPGTE